MSAQGWQAAVATAEVVGNHQGGWLPAAPGDETLPALPSPYATDPRLAHEVETLSATSERWNVPSASPATPPPLPAHLEAEWNADVISPEDAIAWGDPEPAVEPDAIEEAPAARPSGGLFPILVLAAIAIPLSALFGMVAALALLRVLAIGPAPAAHATTLVPRAAVTLPAPRPVGALRVTTAQPGARITLDGEYRGLTPMTFAALTPGAHALSVADEAGARARTVTVETGRTVVVDGSSAVN